MNNTEDVIRYAHLAIFIGYLVAIFLVNTGRDLKAIQLCKECLIFLNNEDLKKQEQFVKLFKIATLQVIFKAYCQISDHTNALKYGRELLLIYRTCAKICEGQCQHAEAKEIYSRAISIMREKGEGNVCRNLGVVYYYLREYVNAKEYSEKALLISMETGDRAEEATSYRDLGIVFQALTEYVQAMECHEKALAISIEIGDRKGKAANYDNLGTVNRLLGEYEKAKECHEKALAISTEIGYTEVKASSYGNLGAVFQCLGVYVKAKECLEIALAIYMEIGDKKSEEALLGNLGTVFQSLGEHVKAKEYLKKALAISMKIGDRARQALNYGELGIVFLYLGEYVQAKEHLNKALSISIEIGDGSRKGKAANYVNLGKVSLYLGEYVQAKKNLEKALAIQTEIGDRSGEAKSYAHLGSVFRILGEQVTAESYLQKALSISKDIGITDVEFHLYCSLILMKLSQEKISEAFVYLQLSINKSEDLRRLLENNDQFKISFSEFHDFPYKTLSAFFCFSENPNNALYVLELERARALADLMAAQYCIGRQISANPQSWIGIENIMKKESNCTCLYISYVGQDVFLWILTTSGVIHFRSKTVNESNASAGLPRDLNAFFGKSFRSFAILPDEDCEDRSLNMVQPDSKSSQEESLANLRLVEDNDEDNQDPEPLFYKMLIAPVADLLKEPEIIIVPDRSLYQVPFAALRDEDGKYLSETFRIRIVPSLSTLKLIQDSPADYHSQTGALIVGDPEVGRVLYKGRTENITPLPYARKEAEMIGQLLGVLPLLGEHATKQAVLQIIHSVSLIHFAAHGNAERGEIALSPVRTTYRTPQEEEYLLTMSDISQVQLRAKLVVLSCCHSGRGQIRAEGVVGIARAFLGSGARSVLVALWALGDIATEQLMRRFYEHLVRGDSVSKSLHEAMKWMRCNGYPKVCDWAPFMLIGDNVTFDFSKIKEEIP
ncbi:hypothetical protein ACROYT_G009103 [Oculina patagonica]